MAFELPKLPYPMDALAPYISKETLQYHYGMHHAAYVKKLNELIKGTPDEGKPLEEIVRSAKGALFNQAAQHWNHSFYWESMAPAEESYWPGTGGPEPGRCVNMAGGEPKGEIDFAIRKSFGSFEAFKAEFNKAAIGHFGNGWAWLVQNADGSLAVESTHDADTPIAHGKRPIITCDLWEHAYYIDYRNARAKYLEAFWNVVNWDFANENLKQAEGALAR